MLPRLRQSVPWTASGRPRISWPGTSFRPTSDIERGRHGIPLARRRDHTQRLAARCRAAEPLARPALSAALPVSFRSHQGSLRGWWPICRMPRLSPAAVRSMRPQWAEVFEVPASITGETLAHDHLRGRPALCNCMQCAAGISTAHSLHYLAWQGAVLSGGDLSGTDRSLGSHRSALGFGVCSRDFDGTPSR